MHSQRLTFLKALLGTSSVSGRELPSQKVWMEYVSAYADRVEMDAYGNAMAFLNEGGSPRILIDGHADEIGFMVRYINEDGFVYFSSIGGVDPSLIRGQRVTIQTRHGPIGGVTGSLAIHMQDRDKPPGIPKIHDCYIDIGASSREEALKMVQTGDIITYVDDFQMLEGELAVARGFDNRVGMFAAAESIRLLSSVGKLRASVVAVTTIQEEIGGAGAMMVSHRLKPDGAVVVDVGQATDYPGASKHQFGDIRLGRGPMLVHGSTNHPALVDRLEKAARSRKIAFQRTINPKGTSTNADKIFVQQGGIPTAVISLPNRYMHTPVEVVHLGDLEKVPKIFAGFCEDLEKGDQFTL